MGDLNNINNISNINSYGISMLISAGLSFFISLILGKIIIPILTKIKYGQTILEIGPSWHKNKQGTPTMGGFIFIISSVISTIISIILYYKISDVNNNLQVYETPLMLTKIFSGLLMAIGYGAIGFIDDYVKVTKKQNQGLTPIQKLILQFGVVICYFLSIYAVNKITGSNNNNLTEVYIPFYGSINLGIFYYIIFAVITVGIVNATNLTDGIDGLCGSVAFFIFIFFMIMTNILNMYGLSLEATALAGSCLGFLFWNLHPAQVFMGDTGSLFLGGIICALGLASNLHVILIIISFVYILEMFSVILQVLYFKLTHGKRLFKMTPIHHHFELSNWSENKICITFSSVTIILGILSLILLNNYK